MGVTTITPARTHGGGFFQGDARKPASDQTWPIGAPVTWDDVAGDMNEHALGATVTNILGFATEAVSAGVSTNLDGLCNYISATRTNEFLAPLTAGSDTIQTPADTDVGKKTYGITKHGSGTTAWYSVDRSNGNATTEVTGYDLALNGVFFKILESAIQEV